MLSPREREPKEREVEVPRTHSEWAAFFPEPTTDTTSITDININTTGDESKKRKSIEMSPGSGNVTPST
jgi:hypothetical protein